MAAVAQAGEKAVEGNQCALTIRLLAAPTYVIVANSIDKEDGLKVCPTAPVVPLSAPIGHGDRRASRPAMSGAQRQAQ